VETLILIGPMGSGKTTLGKKLARELGVQFSDTDKMVARDHGAIVDIFAKFGEPHFRTLETSALIKALALGGVIATGGGIVLSEENRRLLKGYRTVFLDTSSEHVLGKINLSKRPLLKDNPERWDEIYNARKALYQECATATVFTGGKPIKSLLAQLKQEASK
jgi:shikimate kinase